MERARRQRVTSKFVGILRSMQLFDLLGLIVVLEMVTNIYMLVYRSINGEN